MRHWVTDSLRIGDGPEGPSFPNWAAEIAIAPRASTPSQT
jgi:hypothetical protein